MVCSWARAIRKPSDLGFDDSEYILPPLTMRQKIIQARTKKPGHLFDVPAETMQELQEERQMMPDWSRSRGRVCQRDPASRLSSGVT